jgi:hypothetical protein
MLDSSRERTVAAWKKGECSPGTASLFLTVEYANATGTGCYAAEQPAGWLFRWLIAGCYLAVPR